MEADMMLVKGFIDYYLFGKAVDNVNDLIIQKISKDSPKSIQNQLVLHSTCVKVAMCWVECSTVFIVASGGVLFPTVSEALGVLGLVPIVKPFLCNISLHLFKCYQQLSVPEIIVCTTVVTLIFFANYSILNSIISSSSRKYAVFSVVLTDISLEACLVVTAAQIRRNAASARSQSRDIGKKSIQEIVAIKLQQAQEKVNKYQTLIAQIQNFVVKHPELKQLCEEYLVKDKENIAFIPDMGSVKPTNEVDVMTQLTIKGNALEHMFNEYREFILRNEEVAEAFKKYIT